MTNNFRTLISAILAKVNSIYIKNRTHWSEEVNKTLLKLQTIEIGEELYASMPNFNYVVEAGKTYTVRFQDELYNCVAWVSTDEDNCIMLGNGSIYGGNGGNNEPFSIDTYSDGSAYLNTSEAGTYSVEVSSIVEVVHKLDEKFIPDTIARLSDINSEYAKLSDVQSLISTAITGAIGGRY